MTLFYLRGNKHGNAQQLESLAWLYELCSPPHNLYYEVLFLCGAGIEVPKACGICSTCSTLKINLILKEAIPLILHRLSSPFRCFCLHMFQMKQSPPS